MYVHRADVSTLADAVALGMRYFGSFVYAASLVQ